MNDSEIQNIHRQVSDIVNQGCDPGQAIHFSIAATRAGKEDDRTIQARSLRINAAAIETNEDILGVYEDIVVMAISELGAMVEAAHHIISVSTKSSPEIEGRVAALFVRGVATKCGLDLGQIAITMDNASRVHRAMVASADPERSTASMVTEMRRKEGRHES